MSTTINITEEVVNVTVTEETVIVEATGGQGPVGPAGEGVPIGGTTGQYLVKASDASYDTEWITNTDIVGLTSIGLSAPTGLTVSNSPLTSNGTIGLGLSSGYTIPLSTQLVPTDGTTGQILAKNSSTNYDTIWIDNYTEQLRDTVKASVVIAKGQAVYISGATGTNQLVSLASNVSETTSSKTLGLANQNFAINDIGQIITEGLISGIDTSTATAGDPVWLGINGNLIFGLTNKPVAPAHLVYIGVVTRVQSVNGEIYVKIQNGFELQELHNVSIVSPLNNQGIFYNSSNLLWENKSIDTALGYTPVPTTRNLTINGTTYDLSADRTWTITSMIYPSAGIAVSTGTDWGTSIVDNSANWNTAYTNRITSLTTTGTSGAATLIGNVLNIPNYTTDLSGYVTLATTQTITGQKTFNPSVTAATAIARGTYFTPTLTAAANNDVLVGLDINPTFTNGAFTTVNNIGIRIKTATNALAVFEQGVANIHNIPSTFTNVGASLSFSRISDGALGVGNLYTANSNEFWISTYGNLGFSMAGNVYAKWFSTGNLTLGTSPTDTGANFTTQKSITAASAIARGVYFNNTLVAAANNDVLVGLDIAPTFTLGAFTGTSNIALRLNNAIQFTGTPTATSDVNGIYGNNSNTTFFATAGPLPQSSGTNGAFFLLRGNTYNALSTQRGWAVLSSGNVTSPTGPEGCISLFTGNSVEKVRLFSTGNLLIQNGGTFTDAGYRLDVNGTIRVQNKLSISAGTTANAQINLASSTAPTTPANGDIWFDGTNLKIQVGGVTKTFTII